MTFMTDRKLKRYYAITNTSILNESTGYWSNKVVYHNPTEQIVLLQDSLTPQMIERLRFSYWRKNIRHSLEQRITHIVGSNNIIEELSINHASIRAYFFNNDLIKENSVGPSKKVTWKMVASTIEQRYPGQPEKHLDAFIDLVLDAELRKTGNAVKYNRKMGADYILLGHPDLTKLTTSCDNPLELIEHLVELCLFTVPNLFLHDLKSINNASQEALRICKRYSLSVQHIQSQSNASQLLCLSNAAKIMLVILAREQKILLPADWSIFCPTLKIIENSWDWNISTQNSNALAKVLQSSTITSLEDIPENIQQWMPNEYIKSRLNALFCSKLDNHQASNKLKPWPLTNLNRLKQQTKKAMRWSPEWVAANYHDEWACFVEIFYSVSKTAEAGKQASIRPILSWAKTYGITKPSEINITKIRDPSNADSEGTFYHYCANHNASNKSNLWWDSAYSFGVVHNALKLEPNRRLVLNENPFTYLENPFRERRRSKTQRHRIPNSIHELMIEILLSPDDDGAPTYSWVRDSLKWDWYNCKQSGNNTELVWCPSRAACLAILLLLPIRQKQARWLDRGLLDQMIWDQTTKSWKPNTHKLSKWTYPNDESHQARYRRPSGVLQPSDELAINKNGLCIFINTNKTQMWDPDARTGYEIPWPTGGFVSDASNKSKSLRWLERPYKVLETQLQWQNKYNPNPVPTSFLDVSVDRKNTNADKRHLLPSFTPVFADLSSDYYRHNSHELIHPPVSAARLSRLFNALCRETELRMKREGRSIELTKFVGKDARGSYDERVSIFDLHSLRVAGISRLIELGIPIEIVQEFIAGHQSLVMTHHYRKHSNGFLRQKILDSLKESDLLGNWDDLSKSMSSKQEFVVGHQRLREHRPADLLDSYSGWKLVPGGICPLGGTGCDIGQPIEMEAAGNKMRKVYGPVSGGGGNCRFFSTGPAFLIQQAQVCNELMLECRNLGNQRTQIYLALGELDWIEDKSVQDLLEQQTLKENISAIDTKLEPLIQEWFNRYQMFVESQNLLEEWKQVYPGEEQDNSLLLVSSADHREMTKEIEIRLEMCGDFSLVRNILEGAKLKGGLEKAPTLAKDKMREFIDKILRQGNAKHLLLDMPNEKVKNEAAYLMASLASNLVGDSEIQDALDNHKQLKLTEQQRQEWSSWVSTIFSKESWDAKLVDLLPNYQLVELEDNHEPA